MKIFLDSVIIVEGSKVKVITQGHFRVFILKKFDQINVILRFGY